MAAASSGRKWVAPAFILQIRPWRDDETHTDALRYGLTASRKVGNAVARNRARRRLRALAQDILFPNAANNHDYVLIARAATATHAFAALREDLQKALRRLKVEKVK